jgi:hypothetical protein
MRKLVFLAAIFFVALFTFSTGWCFSVIELENGHAYAVIRGRLTWEEARDEALTLEYNGIKGHLATLTTEAENKFVWEELGGDLKHYWLGGQQTGSPEEPSGGWSWVTGELWKFTHWFSPAEANNSGGKQHYLSFWSGPGGNWMDARNDWGGAKGYVVEFSSQAVPLPAPIWLLASGVLGLVAIRRSYGK